MIRPSQKHALTIAKKFIEPWTKNTECTGVMLVGSYATNQQTIRSDVDICIIVNKKERYWERGNRMVDGLLVEYAIYPEHYLSKLQKKDSIDGKQLRKRMLTTGKILYDPYGTLTLFQKKARAEIYKPMQKLTSTEIEIKKYYLWDQLDNLIDLKERRAKGFTYAYFVALKEIVEFYASFKQRELPRPNRLFAFLTEEQFRKKYFIQKIGDTTFEKLFTNAMEVITINNLEKVTRHVHNQTGGFEIEKWTLRRPL